MPEKRYKNNVHLIFHLLKGSKRYFILSIVFGWISSLLDLVNPRIISFTVDSVLGDAALGIPVLLTDLLRRIGGLSVLRQHLGLIAIGILIVAIISAVFRYTFRVFSAKGQETMLVYTRNLLYEHIISLPLSWHNHNHTGDIIQRCTSDVEVIREFLSEQLLTLIRMVLYIVMALYFMLGISIPLTIIVSIFIPIIILFSVFFHMRISTSFRRVDEMEGQLSAVAQENLSGVRVVRAFGRESYERARFEKKNTEYTGLWDHLMHLLSLFWSCGDAIAGLQTLLILLVGAHLCLDGSLSVGGYIAFLAYSAMIAGPVRHLGRVISGMSRAGVSMDRIRYILNAEPESRIKDSRDPSEFMHGDIEFDHVRFRFAKDEPLVLDDLSFTCRGGTVTGILGSTGSGKSTLMDLLCRLYDLPPENGTIRIGGQDIQSIDREQLRKEIGIVLQEPYLFSRTLGENIAITRSAPDMDSVKAASHIAALDDTVSRFAKGYDTFVGERGVTLSGGQKQRTAIAQTLMRKTPIVILDDSLSAVDAETDARIRDAMQHMDTHATTLIISHRITSLMHADRIIVMDKGHVVEQGTHEELYALGGFYRKICDLQSPDQVA